MQPGRPALGVPVQLGRGRLVDPMTQGVRKLERLPIVEAEVQPIELQQRSLGSPARESDRRRCAAGDYEPGPRRQQIGQQAEDVGGRSRRDGVRVIDEQGEGRMVLERAAQAGDRGPRRDRGAGDRLEDRGVDRSDAVESRGEEAHEGSRIVVMIVEGNPRDRASLLGCGLGHERRLAISGGRRDGHECRGRGR